MEKASDALKKLARQARIPITLTRAQKQLVLAGVEIKQEPDAIELAYLARELVSCTLPHTDPGEVPLWTRTNGNITLVLARTGYDAKKRRPIGYPFGSLPRLLLFWLNTEAVQTGKRRLELGHSFSGFVRQLGLDSSQGGPRSDFQRLREQMRRLFSSAINFQAEDVSDGLQLDISVNMNIVSRRELWWDPKSPEQVTLFGSWLELGEDFFKTITASPVPSDMRALTALKRSPLALDLYCWATHKAEYVSRKNKNQFIPWKGLMGQFGSDYGTVKNFRQKAIAALKKIEAVYPGLKLQDAEGGIVVLSSSTPSVPKKPPSRLLES
jgi:hypothetical protein